MEHTTLEMICAGLEGQRLPRWRELPDLELYMDQVLSFVGRYLNGDAGFDGKGLTASMVNNYVKLGIMPAPVKKRYSRSHLAYLIIICVLKPILPIPSIRQLIEAGLATQNEETIYDRFCALFDETRHAAATAHLSAEAESPAMMLCRAALRAEAEQVLSLKLSASLSE